MSGLMPLASVGSSTPVRPHDAPYEPKMTGECPSLAANLHDGTCAHGPSWATSPAPAPAYTHHPPALAPPPPAVLCDRSGALCATPVSQAVRVDLDGPRVRLGDVAHHRAAAFRYQVDGAQRHALLVFGPFFRWAVLRLGLQRLVGPLPGWSASGVLLGMLASAAEVPAGAPLRMG